MTLVVWKQMYKVMAMLWRRRYTIIVTAFCIFFLTALVTSIKPKMYRSHTSILVQESALLNPFLEDLSVSSNLEDRIVALRVLVHSRNNLYAIAIENQLIEPDSHEIDETLQALSDAIKLTLSGNDLVKISLTWAIPTEVKGLLISIKQRFVERLLAPSRASISSSETFLKAQLDLRRKNLSASELQLARFRQENQQVLPELFLTNNKSLDALRTEIREKEITQAGIQAQFDSLKNKLSQTNPVIGVLEQQIILTKSDLSLLLAKYTDKHSKVIALNQKLDHLILERNRLLTQNVVLTDTELEQFWNMAIKVNGESDTVPSLLLSQLEQVALAKSNLTQISQEIKMLKQQENNIVAGLSSEADVARKLNELMRDLAVNKKLYDELYNRHEMAKVTGELGRFEEPEKIKVIDIPFEPKTPINLPFHIYIILSLFAGLVVGFAAAIIQDLFDDTIWSLDQIKSVTDIPVISTIPLIDLDEATR